jgi:hypothetical protein
MRRQCVGDIGLGEGWHGADDQLSAAYRLGNGRSEKCQRRRMSAAKILEQDGAAVGAMCLERRSVAPPHADLVAG